MSLSRSDICEAFADHDIEVVNRATAAKCARICNKYELSVDSFASTCVAVLPKGKKAFELSDLKKVEQRSMGKWEERQNKYSSRIKRRREGMDIDSIAQLDELSQVLNVKAARTSPVDTYLTPVKDASKRRKMELLDFKSPSILASPPSATFQSRPGIGRLCATLNKDLPEITTGVKQTVYIPFSILNTEYNDDSKFRFMYDEPEEKSEQLNSNTAYLMRTLEDDLPKKLEVEEIEFTPVNFPSQKPTLVAGRIVCEAEGQLNAQSILIEGDRALSAGNKMKLDISKLDSYAFFPNQVVAIEGINSNGQCLIATKSFQPEPAPQTETTVQKLLGETQNLNKRPTSIMIATGPYTTTENSLYWPLTALLETVEKKRPDVLVLAGPFVDSRHKDVRLGNLPTTFQTQYETVINTVEQKLSGLNIKILVLPSTNDAHHHAVFPQPPARSQGSQNVEFLSNPSMFKVNDITFGMVNIDVLKHLSTQEISRRGKDKTNRLARLASHLISQRNFYPLFPPAKGSMVDYQHAGMLRMAVRPDVLITPGDLAYFARESADGKSVCVNPGRLSKGSSGGTYAMVSIHKLKEDVIKAQAKEKTPDRQVTKRIRVDIYKI